MVSKSSYQNKANALHEGSIKLLATISGTLIPISFGMGAIVGSGRVFNSAWIPFTLLAANVFFAFTIILAVFILRNEKEDVKIALFYIEIICFIIGLLLLFGVGFGVNYKIFI